MSASKKSETLIQKYEAIQKIGTQVEVPFHVWALFGEKQKSISIVGSDISLGEDYATLEGCRAGVQWYVEQLGGTVKWSKS